MDAHTHGPDGQVIPVIVPVDGDPETVVEVDAVEAAADAAVEIARIEANRDIAMAKESTKREELWQEGRVAELEGKIRGMEEMLERLVPEPAPEPAPVPVVVQDDPADPEDDLAPAPEPSIPAEPEPKKSSGFFGPAYH